MLVVEMLAIAAMLAGPPASVAAPTPHPAMPWVVIYRCEIVRAGRPGMVRTIAARLGAALAWDLADLPRHQIGASQPWGVFRSRPDFAATTLPLAPGDGGAIGACITRWNTLYPPYALTAMDDVDRPVRKENDPSEEP